MFGYRGLFGFQSRSGLPVGAPPSVEPRSPTHPQPLRYLRRAPFVRVRVDAPLCAPSDHALTEHPSHPDAVRFFAETDDSQPADEDGMSPRSVRRQRPSKDLRRPEGSSSRDGKAEARKLGIPWATVMRWKRRVRAELPIKDGHGGKALLRLKTVWAEIKRTVEPTPRGLERSHLLGLEHVLVDSL